MLTCRYGFRQKVLDAILLCGVRAAACETAALILFLPHCLLIRRFACQGLQWHTQPPCEIHSYRKGRAPLSQLIAADHLLRRTQKSGEFFLRHAAGSAECT